ncbi:MAG: aminopeptidase [Chloroflexota bacterium]|nr:aminopeptidase [Chloroflexota bacterium]
MSDPRVVEFAKTLVGFSVRVQPGETVAITGGVAAEPLFRAVFREVVAAGGYPVVLPTFSGLNAVLLKNGNDDQLSYISPTERFLREEVDVMIAIQAETNTKALATVDPARQQFFQSKRRHLFDRYLERSASGELKWVLTLFPTDGFAQDAGLSTEEYADFVYTACKLNGTDPVQAWKALSEEGKRIIEWLKGRKSLHLTGPGTDLTVDITGRTWENSDGTMNFPDGEIFTSPVESGTNGTVTFSYPVVTAGREIEGIVLTFENGKVVKATATKGEDYLNAVLDTDEGARFLGEFAIGTNYDIQMFSKNILFDEKIGGTVHMAIGAGYPETGSVNKSAVHWDMICDLRKGGELRADGDLLMKDGKFVV